MGSYFNSRNQAAQQSPHALIRMTRFSVKTFLRFMRASSMTQRDVMMMMNTGSSGHMCMIRYKLSHMHRNILFIPQKKKNATGFLDLFLGSLIEAPSRVRRLTWIPRPCRVAAAERERTTPGAVTVGFGVDSCCDAFELTTSHRARPVYPRLSNKTSCVTPGGFT